MWKRKSEDDWVSACRNVENIESMDRDNVELVIWVGGLVHSPQTFGALVFCKRKSSGFKSS